VAQPLIKQSNSHIAAVQVPTNIESPKVVASARNIAQERSLQFANNEIAEPANPPGRGVIQS